MKTPIVLASESADSQHPPPGYRLRIKVLTAVLPLFLLTARGWCQGTTTITFDNPPLPADTFSLVNTYSESGMKFWYPGSSSGGLALVGTGSGVGADNGTTHLETYAGSYVDFSLSPIRLFNLISFDASEVYTAHPDPVTLHVVGYKNDMTTATADLTTGGLVQFQTFALGSRFNDLGRVEITPSSWYGFALDNVVIGSVPEPSTGALVLLAAACAFGRSWIRRRRP